MAGRPSTAAEVSAPVGGLKNELSRREIMRRFAEMRNEAFHLQITRPIRAASGRVYKREPHSPHRTADMTLTRLDEVGEAPNVSECEIASSGMENSQVKLHHLNHYGRPQLTALDLKNVKHQWEVPEEFGSVTLYRFLMTISPSKHVVVRH